MDDLIDHSITCMDALMPRAQDAQERPPTGPFVPLDGIAVGPRQGQTAFTLQTVPARAEGDCDARRRGISGRLFAPLRFRGKRSASNQSGTAMPVFCQTRGRDRASVTDRYIGTFK